MQAYGQHMLLITSPTPSPTTAPYYGGGSRGSAMDTYTGNGTLKINSAGTVLKSIRINADDGVGSLLIPIGTTTTPTTTTPGGEPSEGLPMMMILAIFAVVVIIAAAGYFFMMRK